MKSRIFALQNLLSRRGGDALWITSLPNIRWSCGFSGSNGILIIRPDSAHFLSDGRYAVQARHEVEGATVYTPGYDLVGGVIEHGLVEDCRQIVYESDSLTVAAFSELKNRLPNIRWTGEKELFVRMVASKDEDEVRRVQAAQDLTDRVYSTLLEWIRPGITEKEIAAEMVYRHLKLGADGMSFEPIAASGPNSALPHARPTDREIRPGDVLLMDFGCYLDGYASDMTRTVAIGAVDSEVRAVYDVVLTAQTNAIAGARAGMPSKTLDGIARNVIEENGYGDHFTHSLGHGVGLQIHEWPRLSSAVDYDLPRDAVVSIEPGIYLPGRFGIRIEDLVVLREGGAETLTSAPKEWTIL